MRAVTPPDAPEKKGNYMSSSHIGIGGILAAISLFLLLVAICVGGAFGCKAYNRYQARADAKNETITSKKQIQIARNLAQARYRTSIGLRRSQDEIRKTLTPLYVQFELTQALQAIATSGKNNSIIYIPTSPNSGLPVVPTSNTTGPEPQPQK